METCDNSIQLLRIYPVAIDDLGSKYYWMSSWGQQERYFLKGNSGTGCVSAANEPLQSVKSTFLA
jgi:hypothetical protein